MSPKLADEARVIRLASTMTRTPVLTEPKYFDIACRRISEALKQPDMFIERPAPAKQEALL